MLMTLISCFSAQLSGVLPKRGVADLYGHGYTGHDPYVPEHKDGMTGS